MTKEQKSIERAKEICKADGMAIAKHLDETLSTDTIIKHLEDEEPNWKVTSIKIYRDEHGDKSVLVGFKGKASYESGVIYIKRPSMLQMLLYRIKSLFRKKTDDNGIELYSTTRGRCGSK
jgi:hypothetical protein